MSTVAAPPRPPPASPPTRHASCVVVGEKGVLILGRAGAGKSTLALELIAAATAAGGFARLVADDRVALAARGGRLVARPAAMLRGLVEMRGIGIERLAFATGAVVRLVVSLDAEGERLPEERDIMTRIEGVEVAFLAAGRMDHARAGKILHRLGSI